VNRRRPGSRARPLRLFSAVLSVKGIPQMGSRNGAPLGPACRCSKRSPGSRRRATPHPDAMRRYPTLARSPMTEGDEGFPGRREIAQPRRHIDAVADVVVSLHQDHVARRRARADRHRLRRTRDGADDIVQLKDGGQNGGVSTHTSMTPSPSHLAMRTPRREQISRKRARNAVSTSTACSSPSSSVRAVKPEMSTKEKLRWTRTVDRVTFCGRGPQFGRCWRRQTNRRADHVSSTHIVVVASDGRIGSLVGHGLDGGPAHQTRA
jgi:hypothetical protein